MNQPASPEVRMPKRKIAVALSDWLVDELDEVAGRAHASRSSLVEEAVTDYVVRRRRHEDETAYRARAGAALEDMRRYADEYDADPATELESSSLEKLRAIRAEGRGVSG